MRLQYQELRIIVVVHVVNLVLTNSLEYNESPSGANAFLASRADLVGHVY